MENLFERLSELGLVTAVWEEAQVERPDIARNTVVLALKDTNPSTPLRRKIHRIANAFLEARRERPITNGVGYGLSLQDELALAAA